MSALEADTRLIVAAVARIELRLDKVDGRFDNMDGRFDKMDSRFDKMDDRVRGTENAIAGVSGQLALLTGKIPSWWQPYVGTAGLLAMIAAALALAKSAGVLH